MDKIRAFIAVELDPLLRPKIVQLQQEIAAVGADIKAVEAENIHFTLRFLAEITHSTSDAVIACMSKLKVKRFMIDMEGVGCFPNMRNPRVIWVGVTNGLQEFTEVAKQLDSLLREVGLGSEGERFTPHLTIGRVRSGRNKADLIKKLNEMLDVEVGEMTVDSIKLKKSTLTPRGPIYTTLHEVKTS